jgi:NAD(P)H-nitrite reductase large subunit
VFGDGILPRKPAWYQVREIDLRHGVRITAIDRHARLARGSDGSRTTYDRLILAIGGSELSLPGLQAHHGVMVNRSLETSDGHIYAIGGCAEIRDARWAATLDKQARILAARLAGESFGVEAAGKIRRLKLLPLPNLASREAERALTA